MAVIGWIVDNAVWLMLFSNIFSLVVGYWIGTGHPKNNMPDNEMRENVRPSSPGSDADPKS
jgi:hypothetical protein